MTPGLKVLSLFGLSAASIALSAPAFAADDGDSSIVEKAFGSTIVSTYPDGRQGELWLQRDGSYTGAGRRKDPSNGKWSVKGGKLCLKQQRPIPAPFSFCTPLPSSGIDKPWTGKAPTGEAITIRLVHGMRGRDGGSKKAGEDDKDSRG